MAKVTAKYQITIPPEIRKQLGIVPGSEIDIVKENGRYPLVTNPVADLKEKWRGRYKAGQSTMD